MKAIDTIVVGAGGRGNAYGDFALEHPQEMRVVGVAEPDAFRRDRFVGRHDIAPDMVFHDWQSLLVAGEKKAATIINCTMDRFHFESTMQMLALGYDVLLEKPMSPVLEENIRLVQQAEAAGRVLQICHVLRYTPFWQALRDVIHSGAIGRVISVTHRENLTYYHMAHSFVRGNWRQEGASGPMILCKCCHDFDVLLWILQQNVAHLNSFGSLTHFRPEYAPEGATLRCTDGCPAADACKYEATKLYVRDDDGWPQNAVSYAPSREKRLEALKTGWYGRCVYHCDNDVVDHQTVNMEMEDGATVTLVMNGQGDEECRTCVGTAQKRPCMASSQGAAMRFAFTIIWRARLSRFRLSLATAADTAAAIMALSAASSIRYRVDRTKVSRRRGNRWKAICWPLPRRSLG